MYSVTLAGLRFQVPIGLYPEERLLGNDLEINITLRRNTPLQDAPLLDYERLYLLVETEARQEDTLLENLMQRIVHQIEKTFPKTGIAIEIRKWHPPFGGTADYAAISYECDEAPEGPETATGQK